MLPSDHLLKGKIFLGTQGNPGRECMTVLCHLWLPWRRDAQVSIHETLNEEAEPDPGVVLSPERRSEGQAHSTSVLTHWVINTDISGTEKKKNFLESIIEVIILPLSLQCLSNDKGAEHCQSYIQYFLLSFQLRSGGKSRLWNHPQPLRAEVTSFGESAALETAKSKYNASFCTIICIASLSQSHFIVVCMALVLLHGDHSNRPWNLLATNCIWTV